VEQRMKRMFTPTRSTERVTTLPWVNIGKCLEVQCSALGWTLGAGCWCLGCLAISL
jgi:hypothetical protein